MDAVKLAFRNYANFKGRAGRSEYWWFYLFQFLAVFVPGLLGEALFVLGFFQQVPFTHLSRSHGGPPVIHFTAAMVVGSILFVIAWLADATLVLPYLAVTWRRLHDAGYPGPMFFLSLIPYAGGIILIVLNAMPSTAEGMQYEYK
ncbi:DUF805 domain-containing protein [Arthrobacter sp. A333]|uniref:DUF805 domain-containing protein n=1 Tax=Arthrobacter nanjingensis TaxID=1387716 RepID=A0ABU9KLE7_9MICC